jgi:hypothetical protein
MFYKNNLVALYQEVIVSYHQDDIYYNDRKIEDDGCLACPTFLLLVVEFFEKSCKIESWAFGGHPKTDNYYAPIRRVSIY